jgi:hypothetical protein
MHVNTQHTKETIMSNKNPFEIRSEMLQLAKEYMDQQTKMNVDFATKMFEAGEKTAEELKTAMTPYTMDELMEKAKEMYSFVSEKK